MYKIAFLILDDIHHVHHLAPIALTLSERQDCQCVIFIQEHGRVVMNKIRGKYPQHRCEIRVLAPSVWTQIRYRPRKKICRSERIIRHHLQSLLGFDAVISADLDMHELIALSKQAGKKSLFFSIYHGAGDRDRLEYAANKNLDFMLLSGKKFQQRFLKGGYLTPTNHAIIGYPKFDLTPFGKPKLFDNAKPVVLYNPHFVLGISSWQRWGMEILEYFYRQNIYNFIFSPHRNLFSRIIKPKILSKKYFKAKHFIIDLGSEKSVDMTYTEGSDIYLGDVGSQVYEFIRHPKACFFLNAHAVAWREDPHYRSWQMGEVIDQLPNLWQSLNAQPVIHPYVDIQKKLFAETFSITAEPAGLRGANIIYQQLTQNATATN